MSAFMEQSKQALQNFLSTAVVIDDRIYEPPTPPPLNLTPPKRNSTQQDVQEQEKPHESVDSIAYYINHKDLTEAFLKKEILCTLVEPNPTSMQTPEILYKNIENAFKADIIILDWKLQDETTLTKALIEKRLLNNTNNALQLICIYTSQGSLDDILKEIKSLKPSEIFNTPEDNTILQCNNTYFIAIQKANDSEKELPKNIINKFAQVTAGLLPNTVLESFAAIRENTHAVISRFSKDMDPAYITHRVFSNPVDDTMHHIQPLICDEISSILESSTVHQNLSLEQIKNYCDHHKLPKIENVPQHLHLCDKCFQRLLLEGVGFIENSCSSEDMHVDILSSEYTKLFNGEQNADAKFAILTTNNFTYAAIPPKLEGGVILKGGNQYFLCIQPKCDSTRIKGKQNFLFIKLSSQPVPSSGDKTLFSIIVNDNGKYVYLRPSTRAYEIIIKKFKKTGRQRGNILAEKLGHNWTFKSLGAGNVQPEELTFLALLKDMHTQRIIENLANNLSRIGLTESDWVRRCSQ